MSPMLEVSMSLVTHGTAALCFLVSHGPAVIDAIAQMNRMIALGTDLKRFRGIPSYTYQR